MSCVGYVVLLDTVFPSAALHVDFSALPPTALAQRVLCCFRPPRLFDDPRALHGGLAGFLEDLNFGFLHIKFVVNSSSCPEASELKSGMPDLS